VPYSLFSLVFFLIPPLWVAISYYLNIMLNKTIVAIGLDYVRLALAVTFGQKFLTIDFDVKRKLSRTTRKKTGFNGDGDETGMAFVAERGFGS